MDYVIAILQVSGIVILCYLFVMFGISGKLKTFLSDSWGCNNVDYRNEKIY